MVHKVYQLGIEMARDQGPAHPLHSSAPKKYSSAIRIAPYKADFSDLESFKPIHKIDSGFLKSPWYQSFRDQPAKDLFTFIDPKAHTQRRKLMSRPFSKSELRAN